MKKLWNAEPILTLLLGLAGVVDVVLIALEVNGVTHLGAAGCAAIVAAVSSVCGLLAAMLRSAVSPNAKVDALIDRALKIDPPDAFAVSVPGSGHRPIMKLSKGGDREPMVVRTGDTIDLWLERERDRTRRNVEHHRRAA